MRNRLITALAWCLLLILFLAQPSLSGIGISTTRHIPTEYSKPVYSKGKNGKVTYIPAIPTSFEKRSVGIGSRTGRIAVREKKKIVIPRPSVLIRINGEQEPSRVYQGDVFEAGDRRYRMLNIWNDGIEYQLLATGEIFRKSRPRKPRKSKEGDRDE